MQFRFGSIIAGAIQAKWSARKDKAGDIKGSGRKKQRGSFSYFGGMQVLEFPCYILLRVQFYHVLQPSLFHYTGEDVRAFRFFSASAKYSQL